MFRSRLTLFSIRGIPIGVSSSWIFVVAFLVWSLRRLLPHTFPGHSPGVYLTMALWCVILLFASILAHELGHAAVARRQGLHIEGVTLWLFGGVTTLADAFPSPQAEIRIASAGPAVSVGLAVVCGLAAAAVGVAGGPAAVQGVFEYGAAFNLLLAAFNLVPALPLDGGRMFRAALLRGSGRGRPNFAAATRTAAALGKAFGLLLGLVSVAFLASGALVTGVGLAAVGVFIIKGAQAEALPGRLPPALARATVADLLGPDGAVALAPAGAIPLEAGAPAMAAVEALQAPGAQVVVLAGGAPLGVVALADIRRVLRAHDLQRKADRVNRWATRRGLLAGAGVLVALVLVLGVAWHPPVYILSPGPAYDVSRDMTLQGVPARVPGGQYLLTTVDARQHTLLGDLIEAVRSHREVLTTSEVGAFGYQADMFRESQVLAAVAAGRAAGLTVTLSGSGAEVIDGVAGTPAASALRQGDVVVSVDGAPVHTEFDLTAAVAARPVGSRFALSVQRGSARLTVTTASSRLTSGTALGVQLVTRDFAVTGPFTITFAPRGIGGPSGGLVYALAISDALGLITSRPGQAVAATGTIDAGGTVGDVGGVELKAVGAREKGADLLLVPADEAGAPTGLIAQIKPVRTLADALAVLKGRG